MVQSRVDERDAILESNENDNVAYAYVQVENDVVQLLERGWGESPWDPNKTVFAGNGPAQREVLAMQASTPDTGKLLSQSPSAAADGGALPLGLLGLLLMASGLRRRH